MRLDEFPWWATLAISGVTGVMGWFANDLLQRTRVSALAMRDTAIDLASYLTCVEELFPSMVETTPPGVTNDVDDYEILRAAVQKYTSTWEIADPVTELHTFLSAVVDEEIHRLAILFFDRVALFRDASREHYAAYMWLLDNKEHTDPAAPAVLERVESLKQHHDSLLDYSRDLLRLGYELLDVLVDRTTNHRLWHLNPNAFCEFLERRYSLTHRALSARRYYYAADGVTSILSDTAHAPIVRFRVDDDLEVGALRVRVGDVVLDVDPKALASFPSDRIIEVTAVVGGTTVALEVDHTTLRRAREHKRWGEAAEPLEVVVRRPDGQRLRKAGR